MNWKKFSLYLLIAILLSLLILIFGPEKKPIKPVIDTPLHQPVLSYDWTIPTIKKEETANKKTHKKAPLPSKKNQTKKQIKTPFDISICQDNPNAPDYMAKRLQRATDHDDDACAKIKLHMPF